MKGYKARVVCWLSAVAMGLLLSGCAGTGEVSPDETAGSVVLLGFSTEGRPVSELGYYYLLNLSGPGDQSREVIVRPRARDHYQVITELEPGRWTLESYAARGYPGVDGFDPTSLRPRPVDLSFELQADTAAMLSWQLQVTHGEGRTGLTTTEPAFVPVEEDTQNRMARRLDDLGPSWIVQPDPIGERPEQPETNRRSLLDRLFGE